MDDVEEFLRVEIDIGPISSNRQRKMLTGNPVAYMVKKMRDSEVTLGRLPPHERELFVRAKAKEVDSFLKNEAVRKCLDSSEVRQAYSTNRIVKARWVLTWKLVPTDEQKEAKEDADKNPRTLHDRQGRRKAKARIVLLDSNTPAFWTLPSRQRARCSQLLEGICYIFSQHKDNGNSKVWTWPRPFCKRTPRLRMSTCGPQVYKSFVMPLMLARRASCGF